MISPYTTFDNSSIVVGLHLVWICGITPQLRDQVDFLDSLPFDDREGPLDPLAGVEENALPVPTSDQRRAQRDNGERREPRGPKI